MAVDPTRVRDQPALTTSEGRSWLIVGALFSVISLAVLIPMTRLPPAGVALSASVTIVVVYLAMVAVRFTVRPRRRRLGLLAVGLMLIAAVSLVATGIVAFSAHV